MKLPEQPNQDQIKLKDNDSDELEMNNYQSNLSGFWKLSIQERQSQILTRCHLSSPENMSFLNSSEVPIEILDKISENVLGKFALPFSIATNFRINKQDYFIPMVTEEPSIVAAASNGAKFCRDLGGFTCESIKSLMVGQIQITHISDLSKTIEYIQKNETLLLSIANSCFPRLIEKKAGAKQIEFHEIKTSRGSMLILHLLVDVCDAMGANIVNTMVEHVAHEIQENISGKILLKIISNFAIQRVAKCRAVFDTTLLGGISVVEDILDAVAFAESDPYRATTHNKGIMNGIIALTVATGNDSRAIEAGSHSYAVKNGQYSSLTKYYLDKNNNLVGEIEIPMALGVVGGLTKIHPMVSLALKIMRVKSAEELSQIAAAVGLAQNIAALRALVTDGIQKGHMALHQKKFTRIE